MKYQITYEIVGYIPTTPCVERVDRQVRRYAWNVATSCTNEVVGTERTYRCAVHVAI